MALVCSTQPENPGTPPFWTEVSIYELPVRKDVSRFARMAKNIFPSTLSNEIVLNWLTVLEFRSFGVNIPSASFQEARTSPFRQTTFKSLHNRLRSSGHILYTLYGMALGPGAEAVLAFLTTSFTSPNDGSETSSCFSGAFTGSIRSQSPRASSRLGSEWVTWRYFSTSSSGVSNFPDLSLSSKDLANLYGLAVNAALFFALSLVFLLVFSAFRSEVSCDRNVALS